MPISLKLSASKSLNEPVIGFAAAVAATVIMGCFGVFVRQVTASETTIALTRFSSGCVFLGFGLMMRGPRGVFRVPPSYPLALSGIFLALCILFYSKAIQETTLAVSVFLLYLAPVLATLLARLFLRERLSKMNSLLILLAFSGSLLVLRFEATSELLRSGGHFHGLASALFYALFIIANRSIGTDIPAFTRAFYQLLFGTLTLLPWISVNDFQEFGKDWQWLLAIGFLHGFLALTLVIVSLKFLKAYQYGTVAYCEPIVASLTGYWFFRETLTAWQIAGCAIILASGLLQIYASRDLIKGKS